jgi:carbon starvation protein
MVTEMCVGVMALIAACAMQPGQYLAINMAGDAQAVVTKVTALGFPVTASQMNQLALSVGEKTMIGRTGGAPTFAVGMAELFSAALEKTHLGKSVHQVVLSLWYHFAIMFEALFILTTLDAGTRVGRFLVQDLLGYKWKSLGNTQSILGSVLATALFVGAWGWFLYQGVLDPLGGINSLWPIFGVGNQLLAVIALAFGTTVLIKMKRVRYVWVTLIPLIWLLSVTMTAGLMKIFSNNQKLGFLSGAQSLQSQLSTATTSQASSFLKQQIFNGYVDALVTAAFLLLVAIVVTANARVWIRLLINPSSAQLNEDPYVAVATKSV